ncbi:MAG: exo-alpha-sialidase [Roseivirga sp.]
MSKTHAADPATTQSNNPTTDQSKTWKFIGPKGFGSRALCIAIDPTDAKHVYCGSASSGLWRSTDGAENWKMVDTGFPVTGVGAVAFHPDRPKTIYVGTGEVYGYQQSRKGFDVITTRGSYGFGILGSNDGGKTWSLCLDWTSPGTTGVQDLAVCTDKHGKTIIWAATTEGVWRAEMSKAGKLPKHGDWKISLDVKMATSLSVNTADPDDLIVACGGLGLPERGIYRSTDSGASWHKLVRGLPISWVGKAILARSTSNPSVVYVSIGNKTGFEYSGAGITQNGDKTGQPGDIQEMYRAHFVSKTILEPVNYLCRSMDAGTSWDIVNKGSYAGSQGWYALGLAVMADSPFDIMVAGEEMYRSYDGGRSLAKDHEMDDYGQGSKPAKHRAIYSSIYDKMNDSITLVDYHAIVVAPSDPDVIYFAVDQGIFRSTDKGASLVRCNKGYNTIQFYPDGAQSEKNDQFLAFNAQDYGAGYLHYKGNSQWSLVDGYGFEGGFVAYDDTNDIVFAGVQLNTRVGRVYASDPSKGPDAPDGENGGKNFIVAPDAFQRSPNVLNTTSWNAPLVAAPSNPGTLYATRDIVLKSTGINVKAAPERPATNTPAGETWIPTNLGEDLDGNPILRLAVHPEKEDHLIIATAPRYSWMSVFRSTDGGRTWSGLTQGIDMKHRHREPTSLRIHPDKPGSVYMTFSDPQAGHIWTLENAWGDKPGDWQCIDGKGLPHVHTSDCIPDPDVDGQLFAGNDYGVYRSKDHGARWEKLHNGEMPTGVQVIQLLLARKSRLLRAATYGNGVYELKIR